MVKFSATTRAKALRTNLRRRKQAKAAVPEHDSNQGPEPTDTATNHNQLLQPGKGK